MFENKLLTFENPNYDIMVVPPQFGGAEDDNYFGSIGDATMQHLYALTDGEMQLWNELLVMRDGNMFRMVPSLDYVERDESNVRGVKDPTKLIEEYRAKLQGFPEDEVERILQGIREEVDNELERREASEDALDQERIPFSEWEKFPGMWNHIDIPSTPRNRFVYVGNTRQAYYDVFPEGHPDEWAINAVISMVNPEENTEVPETHFFGVKKTVEKWCNQSRITSNLRDQLLIIVRCAEYEKPWELDETIKMVLCQIDNDWRREFNKNVAERSLKSSMVKLILKKEREWEQLYKTGYNVLPAIKKFGQVLFKNYRQKMTGGLWRRYRRAKERYAPRLMVHGLDINRCFRSELHRELGMDHDQAMNVWWNRPFETLEEAFHAGHLKAANFANDEKTETLVAFIQKHTDIALPSGDLQRVSEVRKILMNMQRDKKGDLTSSQWNMVWRFYKICKQDVQDAANQIAGGHNV